ncbi:MAG: Helix-hairpin-helix DNA-binding class 1, partial [Bacteroidetes bacterium]|nr:Helix-hairpin-helix DNA-binding class 1 [Bacteroidota bacterium]
MENLSCVDMRIIWWFFFNIVLLAVAIKKMGLVVQKGVVMKHPILLLLVCIHCESYAAFEHLARGSNVIAMGGASVSLRSNPWAAFENPGSLTTLEARTLSLHYSPQPFGLKELSHGSFSYVEPTDIGTFAASGSRFGFNLYREIDLHISYGVAVNDLFSVGVSIHYYHLSIERYGSAKTFGIDIGMLAELTEEICWGFTAFNVNAPTIGVSREKLQQVFVAGISYSPIPE